jgi:hypothetical protein
MVSGTYGIGGWMDPRAHLEYMDKYNFSALQGLEIQLVGRVARSRSLYRRRYRRCTNSRKEISQWLESASELYRATIACRRS